MALPADFSKIYGSTATGGLTPISDVNYAKGWEFVGSNPPTKNDFSYLQNLSDLKSQWLYSNRLQREDPFGDIKSDGAAAISTALTNLRLGSGAPVIGIPFFWPSTSMPNTVIDEWSDMVFLKFNGSSFSAAAYPKLAQVLPGLMLPEARGEFPRIWDDGRGVDSGRALLSTQVDAIRNITGEVGFIQYFGQTHQSGALYSGGSQNVTNLGAGGGTVAQSIFFDASKDTTVSIANENRPRNIAFNFLVRAK